MRLTDSDQKFLKELFDFTVNARNMAKKSISTFNANFHYHDNTVTGVRYEPSSECFKDIFNSFRGSESDYIFFEASILENSDPPSSKTLVLYNDDYVPEKITFEFDNDIITCCRTDHETEITEDLIVIESASDFFSIDITNESTLTYEDILFFKELFKTIEDNFELRYSPKEQYKYGWTDE